MSAAVTIVRVKMRPFGVQICGHATIRPWAFEHFVPIGTITHRPVASQAASHS